MAAIDWRHDRLGAAERGENPLVLARARSGFVVLGDTQFLPGYCLLLRSPRAEHLSALSPDERREFLFEMSLVGEAIERVCGPQGLRRVNYEIAGNSDPFVHAHIIPRYEWEPADYRVVPAVVYPAAIRAAPEHRYSPELHGDLRARLTEALREILS